MFRLSLLLIRTGLLEFWASTCELGSWGKAHLRGRSDLNRRCLSLSFLQEKSVLQSASELTLLKCSLLICKHWDGNK